MRLSGSGECFHFIIHSVVLASSRHSLSCKPNLSWVDVKFGNQNRFTLLYTGIFQFSNLLSECSYMYTSGSSILFNYFFYIIHPVGIFCYFLSVPIFSFSNCLASFASTCWSIFMHSSNDLFEKKCSLVIFKGLLDLFYLTLYLNLFPPLSFAIFF